MDRRLRRKIIDRWMRHAPLRWWGDPVDIRFLLAERLSALNGHRVLDVGCNAGVLASVTAESGNDVYGLELERDALESYREIFATEELSLRAVCGNWHNLPFSPGSFDTLIMGWTLYYDATIEQKIHTIESLSDLLVSGGEIHFVEANRRCPIQARGNNCFWTPGEAADFFSSRGFKVEELIGWNPLPSLLCWLPSEVKLRLPRGVLLALYPPGKLVQYFPGWYRLFEHLGGYPFLRESCRSYYLRAVKT